MGTMISWVHGLDPMQRRDSAREALVHTCRSSAVGPLRRWLATARDTQHLISYLQARISHHMQAGSRIVASIDVPAPGHESSLPAPSTQLGPYAVNLLPQQSKGIDACPSSGTEAAAGSADLQPSHTSWTLTRSTMHKMSPLVALIMFKESSR